jgi:transcription initiation factor IIE alpha subunit
VKRRVLEYMEPGRRTTTDEIAAGTGVEPEDVRPVLSWMRDYGWLEAVMPQQASARTQLTYWVLTDEGVAERDRLGRP